MKPSKIFDVLDLARRARKNNMIWNPCFVGAPGIAKSEAVQQWCKQNNLPFIIWTSALLEPPDVRGFPSIKEVNGKQRMTTAVPDIWPDSGEGVVILEEMNRGTTSIMNCWMGLSDVRRGFDNYTLPPGWIVVACINPSDGEYDTNSMDAALQDRFEFFQVAYDKPSFIQYMREVNWDENVIMFVESGAWNYVLPENVGTAPGNKYISPRTLSKLNAAIKAGIDPDDELMVYESVLGLNIGTNFYKFKYDETPVVWGDIAKSKRSALKKLKTFSDPSNYKSGYISITIRSIIELGSADPNDGGITDDLLAEVCMALPADQAYVLIRDLEYERQDNTIINRIVSSKKYPELSQYLGSVLIYKKANK